MIGGALVECGCGGRYTYKNRTAHEKTLIHQKYMRIEYYNGIKTL